MLSLPKRFHPIFLLLVFLTGCSSAPAPAITPSVGLTASPTSSAEPASTQKPSTPSPEAAAPRESEQAIALTHQRLDGNRLVSGSGGSTTEPVDIPLAGKPVWVVGIQSQGGSVWAAALEDGEAQAFRIEGKNVSEIKLNISKLPAGMPPVLEIAGNRSELLHPFPVASDFTNPIRLEDGAQAYVDKRGQLRLVRQDEQYILAVDALPDARILADEESRLLFLTGPTEGYPHDVLGDPLEAKTITLVDAQEHPYVSGVIQIDPGDVIEGIAPIWVDLDEDGEREIIVTQSNAGSGARIVVYREDGSLYASGEPIGQGFRWRHQLAAAQFIPGGPLEIAVIRTPHIGGVLELYAVEGGRLVVRTELHGYSSHQIGSRNLDGALAADFDGDGKIEVVVPDQSQTNLAGIEWERNELKVAWEAAIGGGLSTNLAAVRLADGRLALGVGHDGNRLRIWQPE